MALKPRDVPITRAEVSGWLNIYRQLPANKQQKLEDFLTSRIAAKNMPDTLVDTSGHDDRGTTSSILSMILDDLPSYG